jgi:hypothetical protein
MSADAAMVLVPNLDGTKEDLFSPDSQKTDF